MRKPLLTCLHVVNEKAHACYGPDEEMCRRLSYLTDNNTCETIETVNKYDRLNRPCLPQN